MDSIIMLCWRIVVTLDDRTLYTPYQFKGIYTNYKSLSRNLSVIINTKGLPSDKLQEYKEINSYCIVNSDYIERGLIKLFEFGRTASWPNDRFELVKDRIYLEEAQLYHAV